MDPKVFAWQRALNLQKAIFEMEEHNQGKKMTTFALGEGSLGRNKSESISDNIDHSDESWDLKIMCVILSNGRSYKHQR